MTLDSCQCNTCNKSFPTIQTLGGHKPSHNKKKSKSPMDEQRLLDNIEELSQSSSKTPRTLIWMSC